MGSVIEPRTNGLRPRNSWCVACMQENSRNTLEREPSCLHSCSSDTPSGTREKAVRSQERTGRIGLTITVGELQSYPHAAFPAAKSIWLSPRASKPTQSMKSSQPWLRSLTTSAELWTPASPRNRRNHLISWQIGQARLQQTSAVPSSRKPSHPVSDAFSGTPPAASYSASRRVNSALA